MTGGRDIEIFRYLPDGTTVPKGVAKVIVTNITLVPLAQKAESARLGGYPNCAEGRVNLKQESPGKGSNHEA